MNDICVTVLYANCSQIHEIPRKTIQKTIILGQKHVLIELVRPSRINRDKKSIVSCQEFTANTMYLHCYTSKDRIVPPPRIGHLCVSQTNKNK